MAEVTKEVKEFGNGAHVVVPKDWKGEEVEISLKENSDEWSFQ